MTHSPREMIETLVGFPTVSRDSNLNLIHFVRDYLAGCGVDSHLVPNEDATKANLYATIGPDAEGGVVLSGIPTWCRSTGSRGIPTRSRWWSAMAASTGAAPRT